MLGILLIYFIGKKFYDLADQFNKNKWLFGIVGALSYYGLGFLFTLAIMFMDIWYFEWGLNWDESYGASLLVIPFGLLSVWGLYTLLKTRWEKSYVPVINEIEDIGKPLD